MAAGEQFWLLDQPVIRIGAPDVPVPAAPSLQAAIFPDAERIAAEIQAQLSKTAAPARA